MEYLLTQNARKRRQRRILKTMSDKLTIMTESTRLVIGFETNEEADIELAKIRDTLFGLDQKSGLFNNKEKRVWPNVLYYGRNAIALSSSHSPYPDVSDFISRTISSVPEPKEGSLVNIPKNAKVIDSPYSVHVDTSPIPPIINPVYTSWAKKSREVKSQVSKPQESPQVKTPTVHGFLHIKCEHCGSVGSFFVKPERAKEEYMCTKCSKISSLEGLRRLVAQCKCGKRWIYKTNLKPQDAPFDKPCLECDSLIPIKYNESTDSFDTMN
jgi:DNA-directed RNA polymerase subunit RPC12/RpoP